MNIILIISMIAHALILRASRRDDRLIQAMLLLSHVYYCAGGYYYWAVEQGGYFVGFSWGLDRLERAFYYLSLSTLALSFSILILSSIFYKTPRWIRQFNPGAVADVPAFAWVFLSIGVGAALAVVIGSVFNSSYSWDQRGSLFLVAYGVADILISMLAFLIAAQGLGGRNILLSLFFLIYAVMAGFRYKIALFAVPVLAILVYEPISRIRKLFLLILASVLLVFLFSILTLFRVKFSLPDFSRALSNPTSDILYGFFAETNSIFGLSSILTELMDQNIFYPLDPVVDIFKEWVPRALMPDKQTGVYLEAIRAGFYSDEGVVSSTAYPWVGEFIVMGGVSGAILGVVALASFYVFMRLTVARLAKTSRQYYAALGLIAGTIGYYHYSRGFLPQIGKCYLFVVAPYMLVMQFSVAKERHQYTKMLKLKKFGHLVV